jgi:hypothetical protein
VPSITSNAFSPPDASVIYATFAMESVANVAGPVIASVANTGTPLVWHLKGRENHVSATVGGFVEVWWAYNPTHQTGMTITGTFGQPSKNVTPPVGALQVLVLDNAAADQTSAAWTPSFDVGAGSLPSGTVTTTAANSLVFGIVTNWDTPDTPTVPANQTITINGLTALITNFPDRDGDWIQMQKAATAVPGPVTINNTFPTIRYHMITWEVLGA